MKRNLLIICFCFSLLSLGAQNTFSDNVESYKVGDYVAKSSTYWTVWSGAVGEGTQEDALITDENAKSGTKSIRLEAATAAGGPTDLVLPFGGEKNIGKLTYEMWIYVLSDQAAYFNFQAKICMLVVLLICEIKGVTLFTPFLSILFLASRMSKKNKLI